MSELIPSLAEAVQREGLNPDKIAVAFQTDSQKHIRVPDKHTVTISDGEKAASWVVPSLRELFRGDRQPPADMDHYPEEYTPHFFFIESQVLTICDIMGDRSDQEMEDIYAALARRPDGRSLNVVHDVIWQLAALLLGRIVLSEAEYTALIGALAHSVRRWAQRPISRNYAAYLRQTFSQVKSGSGRN